MGLRSLWHRPFLKGVIVGVALVLVGRLAINESTFPDHLIAPLLLEDSSAQADAIVVLGAGVIGDCVANLNGVRRALLGARLLKSGRAPLLVITGGSGGNHCPVADAMALVARDAGVPADRLVLERTSQNTYENGTQTAPLLREHKVHRILVVTDRLHMRRAAGVFRRLGFMVEPVAVPIYEGHEDNVSMLSAGIREAAALAYYRLRGWTTAGESAAARASTDAQPSAAIGTSGERRSADNPVNTLETPDTASAKTAGAADRRPIVILGASYAAGWKLSELDGIPVINAGVAGQQSFELLARFESDVVAARPRAVVVWGFINDIFRADDVSRAIGRVRDSYTEIITRARAQGIEPIVATEVTIRPPKSLTEPLMTLVGSALGKQSYQDRINQHVMETNRWLRELGRREGLLLLDLEAALADSSGRRRREFATDDGSHIAPVGYEALTAYARPLLVKQVRTPAPSGRR